MTSLQGQGLTGSPLPSHTRVHQGMQQFELGPHGSAGGGCFHRSDVLHFHCGRNQTTNCEPTTHRRASVTPIRQRTVEIGGGSGTPSCVQVTAGLPLLCHKRDRSDAGGGTVLPGISAGNARRVTAQAAYPRQIRPASGHSRASATSRRDKWRLRRMFVSTIR